MCSVDDIALFLFFEDKIDLSAGALLPGDTGFDFLAGGQAVQVKRVASMSVDEFSSVGATRLASLLSGTRVPGATSVTPSSVDARVFPAKFNAAKFIGSTQTPASFSQRSVGRIGPRQGRGPADVSRALSRTSIPFLTRELGHG